MQLPAFSVPKRRAIAVALVGLVVLLVLWRHHGGSTAAVTPLRVAPIVPNAAGQAQAGRSPVLVIDVAGAVRRPGLVRVPHGARVADAIARAGGLTAAANRDAVNLAAPVVDGEQVLVTGGSSSGSAGVTGNAAPASSPVSLSTATAEQLDTLPGVGPVTALKIVAYRQQHGPFTSLEGLDAIPGIGPARISDLKGLAVP